MVPAFTRLTLAPLVLIVAFAVCFAVFEPFGAVNSWRTATADAQIRLAALISREKVAGSGAAIAVLQAPSPSRPSATRRSGLAQDEPQAIAEVARKAGARSVRTIVGRPGTKTHAFLSDGALQVHVLTEAQIANPTEETKALLKNASVVIGSAGSDRERQALKAEARAYAFSQNGFNYTRPPWALGAELGFGFLLALAAGLAALANQVRTGLWICTAGTGIAIASAFGLLWINSGVFDPVLPALYGFAGLGLAWASFSARHRLVETWLSRRMGHTPPETLVRMATLDPGAVSFEPRSNDITVLALKVRGATALAETYRARPDHLAKIMTDVLAMAADTARAHGAMIERQSGDKLTAFWNVPFEEAEHAQKACDAALAILGRMEPLNEALAKDHEDLGQPFKPLQIAIGIETGRCFVGPTRRDGIGDLSLIGLAVKRALENCERSPVYGPAILVGRETRALTAKQFALLPIDLLEGDEKIRTRPLFALLGNPLLRANPRFKAMHEAMTAFCGSMLKANSGSQPNCLANARKCKGSTSGSSRSLPKG